MSEEVEAREIMAEMEAMAEMVDMEVLGALLAKEVIRVQAWDLVHLEITALMESVAKKIRRKSIVFCNILFTINV